ncbi:MAG: A/G-specific adenine glycosylase [Candidatus Dactylopiibacterium carminicum]|nr:MAG: A/G-specific adenine glycosylase [Candidatus Dactylopiibacterium carminicum]
MSDFAYRLIAWQRRHGRHDLPWQGSHDPYRVWLSEIMLQQTQVDTVIPYYLRFLDRFPDVTSLAGAQSEAVMALWSGLGYYARARNLHRAAQAVVQLHGGEFPRNAAALAELPGIGRSTAAAIAAFCFGERAAILDGNVKRVLCRHFGIEGHPDQPAINRQLWALAESLLPAHDCDVYPQAQMDLGATVCTRTRPACLHCPVAETCLARREGRQAELPTPRARRSLPQREWQVLLVRTPQAALLAQRPPIGIWGGLLSLPEIAPGESASAAALRYLGLAGAQCNELPPLRHTFTHFQLNLRPWLLELAALPKQLADAAGLRWVALDTLADCGLPAPVRVLLDGLAPFRLR